MSHPKLNETQLSTLRADIKAANKSRFRLIRELSDKGVSETEARALVDRLSAEIHGGPTADERRAFRAERRTIERDANYRIMVYTGLAIAAAGGAITAASYLLANDSGPGSVIVVCWGAILFGLGQFAYGLYRLIGTD